MSTKNTTRSAAYARRQALRRGGLAAAGIAAGAARWLVPPAYAQGKALAATPRDAEGPFYPRTFPADVDADLLRVAGRPRVARGTPLRLSGRVLGTDGKPLAGATLELWQCDVEGTYHHVGASGPQDDDFQGYGRAIADAEGAWAFTTIRPVPYGGRPAHLHFRIAHPRSRTLTTQLYLKGESSESGMGGFFSRERDRLEIAPVQAQAAREPGALAATYTFVLEAA